MKFPYGDLTEEEKAVYSSIKKNPILLNKINKDLSLIEENLIDSEETIEKVHVNPLAKNPRGAEYWSVLTKLESGKVFSLTYLKEDYT